MKLKKEHLKALKEGNLLTFHNSTDGEGDFFTLHLSRWGHFALEKNGQIIKANKTIKPILKKLQFDNVILELTEINN